MEYKGYTATVEIDEDSKTIYGKVAGIRDIVTFEAATAEGAIHEFHESVDDYLDFCKMRGEEPDTPKKEDR